ncbi:uncharacterized protein LOC141909341 [Tubulanus polymorphus]|uniref:uncharacterized protein LOC141909341 n=1 Tax=Tubulanus polymorphus TaxID=672921 RepID=UPI003DA30057
MSDSSAAQDRDIKEFLFKRLARIRVSPTPPSLPINRSNLVASAKNYSLVFVGYENGFRVLNTCDVIVHSEGKDKGNSVIEDFPFLTDVALPSRPVYISTSTDGLTVAVALNNQHNQPIVYLYDVRIFTGKAVNVERFTEVLLSSDAALTLQDFSWNPVHAGMFSTCLSNGCLTLWNLKDVTVSVVAQKLDANVSCVVWSPKGTQMIVGRFDGVIDFYDHQMNLKKQLPCPPLFDQPMKVVDIKCLSANAFLGAYTTIQTDLTLQPQLVMTHSFKDKPLSYTNYEDICYGCEEQRIQQYFLTFITEWSMIVAVSSKGQEAGIIGRSPQNKNIWEMWNLDDTGRAELPLNQSNDNTFPVGITIDFTPQAEIRIDDVNVHPPSPIIYLLSTDGVLCPFHMMYTGAPSIVHPAQPLPVDGVRIGKPSFAPVAPQTTGGNLGGATVTGGGASSILGGATVTGGGASSILGGATVTGGGASSILGGAAGAAVSGGTKPLVFGQQAIAETGQSNMLSQLLNKQAGVGSQPGAFLGAQSGAFPRVQQPGAQIRAPQPGGLFGAQPGAQITAPQPGGLFGAQPGAQITAPQPGGLFGAQPGAQIRAPQPGGLFGAQQPGGQIRAPQPGGLFGAQPGAQQPTAQVRAPQPGGLFGAQPGAQQPGAQIRAPQPGGLFGAQPGAQVGGSGDGGSKPTLLSTTPFSFGSTQAPPPSAGFDVKTTKPGFSATSKLPFTPTPTKPGPTTNPAPTPVNLAPKPTSGLKPATSSTDYKPGLISNAPVASNSSSSVKHKLTDQQRAPAIPPNLQSRKSATDAVNKSVAGAATYDLDNPFVKSILDEMSVFQLELNGLRERGSACKIDIANGDEIRRLLKDTDRLFNFCNEAKETTQIINKEITELKSESLETLATLQECCMRQKLNNDPKYQQLLRTRSLDPVSLRIINKIQHQYQYLESGINDVNLVLDSEWEAYQTSRKHRTNKMKRPAADTIYHTLSCNSRIIQEQDRRMNQLTDLLHNMKLFNASPWKHDQNNGDFSSPVLSAERINQRAPVSSPMSPEKQAKLRDILSKRKVTPIKSTAPANLSMSKIATAETLRERLLNSSEADEDLTDSEVQDISSFSSVNLSASTPAKPSVTSAAIKPGLKPIPESERNKNVIVEDISSIIGKPAAAENNRKIPAKSDQRNVIVQDISSIITPPDSRSTPTAVTQQPKPVISLFGTAPPGGGVGQTKFSSQKTLFGGDSIVQKEKIPLPRVEDITPPSTPSITHNKPSFVKSILGATQPSSNSSGSALKSTLGATQPSNSAMSSTFGATQPPSSFAVKLPPGAAQPFSGGSTTTSSSFTFTPVSFASGNTSASSKTKSQSSVSSFSIVQPTASKPVASTVLQPTPSKPVTPGLTKPSATVPVSGSLFVAPDSTSSGAGLKLGHTSSTAFNFGQQKSMTTATKFTPPATTESVSSQSGFKFGQSSSSDSTTKTDKVGFDFTSGSQFVFGETPSQPDTKSTGFSFTPAPSAPPSGLLGDKPSNTLFGQKSSAPSTDSTTTVPSTGESVKPSTTASSTSAPTGLLGTTAPSITAPSTGLFGTAAASSSDGTTAASSSAPSTGLFGTTAASSLAPSTGLFGATAASSSAPSTGLFGTTAASSTAPSTGLFGTTTASTTAPSAGLFGATASSAAPSTGLFGTTTASTTAPSAGLFGATTASSAAPSTGLFGTTTASTTAPSAGLFGATTASSAAPSTGLFGTTTASSSAPSTGLFGATATSSSAPSTGLFSATTASTTAPSTGLFGATTASSAAPSTGLFGASTASSAAPSTGLFGTTTANTPAPSGGLFGQTTASSQAPSTGLFGSTASSSAPSTGLFGTAAASTAAPSTGLFGTAAASTAAPSTGLFGTAAASTAAPSTGLFGTAAASTAAPSTGLFGSAAANTAAPSTGLFGQSSTSAPGVFGQTGGSSSPSLFGKTSSSAPSTGLFGQAPVFGQPASNTGSLFGQSSGAATSVFGGSAASTTATSFNQNSTSTGGGLFGAAPSQQNNSFGRPATFGQTGSSNSAAAASNPVFGTSTFGQSQPQQSSVFGGGDSSSNSGGLFGGNGGGVFGLGGLPSAENANKNVFGQPTQFQQTSSNASLFGSGAANPVASPVSSPQGSFTQGRSNIAQQGFGLSNKPAAASGGFGAAPVFGSPVAFGTPPSFGGAASPSGGVFGSSSATFGAMSSPSSGVFGGGGASGGVGAGGGFASLAQSGGPSFGNLAQQAGAGSGFGGSTFGGAASTPPSSSFSSYRS